MKKEELLSLSKEELISLIKETEDRFVESNIHSAELVVAIEERNEELKKMQSQKIHDAKLISIGELSAGIGHEINNPLTIISGNMLLLKKHIRDKNIDDEKIEKSIKGCEQAILRITNIVKSLKTFSRNDKDEEREVIDCHEMINLALGFVKNIYTSEGVIIDLKLMATKDRVLGVSGEFQQVVINFLSNAKDATAMNEKQIISISSENINDRLILRFEDNGHGMTEEVKAKIFDSFFTTKKVGVGTGLGLSISAQIIHKMMGEITVESKVGAGTTFRLSFPLSES